MMKKVKNGFKVQNLWKNEGIYVDGHMKTRGLDYRKMAHCMAAAILPSSFSFCSTSSDQGNPRESRMQFSN